VRHALLATIVAVLLTGCATLPSGSQVVSGRVGGHEQPIDDPYVRIIPVGPGRDWDPNTIVTAFRTASASFDGPNGEHQVARRYLACGGCWQPGVASIVYDHLDLLPMQLNGDQVSVTVEGAQLGRIGSDGQYLADARRFKQTFRLRRDAQKQWRITDLPQELLLSRDDVNRAFRTLNLYFFAPDAQVLVPNPVFIPMVSRPWLSVQLVKQLLGGPTTWLKGAAVRTGLPAGTQLRRLDISGGLATVDLSRQARTGDLRNMSIQLMWTLRQLRQVDQLKLEIDGKPVQVPGVNGTLQSAGDWAGFDPDGIGDPPPAYVRTDEGRLERLDNYGEHVLLPKLRVAHPAVSYDGRQVAALNDAGDTVTVTDLTSGATRVVLPATLKGGRFSTPSWDSRGNVWAVESNAGGSRLWEIEGGTTTVAVDGWTLSPYTVKALRISRDGTRAAAIVQVGGISQVQLGRVDRAPSGGLQAEGFIAISSELQSAIDLAWRNADHLAVVGVTQGNPSPLLYDVPVSGAAIQPMVGPGGDMKAIAAYPGAPLLVTQHVSNAKSRDNVCRLSDKYGEWKCFGGTSAPAYPG
jgi:hypothetical protein